MGELSRFKRFLGAIGKRIYFWREPKESINFMSFMYESIIEEYADVFDGDYEKSMDMLVELIKPMSLEVAAKIIIGVKVFGIAFKTLLTKDIEDLPFIFETLLYAVFGHWSKKMYKKPVLIPAAKSEQQVDTIVLELTQCPFCCYTMIPPEKFGAHKYGKLHILTIEQVAQEVEDYIGNEVKVVSRETKCFLNGDSRGEIRIWFYPLDKLDLMEKNPYLRKIK